MYGFHDRIAWVDLTRGKIEVRPVGAEDARRFVGGANLGAAILARMVDGSTDPLGPENPLIFMTGPLNATSAPTNSRFEVVALSPLTDNYGESNSGGAFARQLKLSGLDGIVFIGQSDKPVALVIDGSEIGLRPCDDWWGKDVFEMEDSVNAEFGKGTVCTCIGPSGEKKVLLAGIATGGRETRMAGRCGMGAVMGSKMLKALIVTSKGKAEHPLADAAGLKATMSEKVGKMRQDLSLFTKYGTPGSIGNFDRLGNLPISNWRGARTHAAGREDLRPDHVRYHHDPACRVPALPVPVRPRRACEGRTLRNRSQCRGAGIRNAGFLRQHAGCRQPGRHRQGQ